VETAAFGIAMTIMLTACGQLCLKRSTALGAPLWEIVRNPFFLGGLVLYGLSTIIYLMVLRQIRVSVAFPVVFGGTSVLVCLLGRVLLGEMLHLSQVGGVFLVIAGAFLLLSG